MRRKALFSACLPALVLAGLGAGCGISSSGEGPAAPMPRADEVLVFAAASTANALDQILDDFRRSRPGTHVRTSYAASSILAQQITAGAPAQLFIPADVRWAGYLAERGLVAEQRNLLGNELVLIVPADSNLRLAQPEDLLAPAVRRLALGDPESVPAGIYARQALTKLGLWDELAPKVVAAADVQQVVAYVEMANAEAGIVYVSDAAATGSVRVAARLDPGLTEPIVYPLVLVQHEAESRAARALYQHLGSRAAAEVFRRHGFQVLAQPASAE